MPRIFHMFAFSIFLIMLFFWNFSHALYIFAFLEHFLLAFCIEFAVFMFSKHIFCKFLRVFLLFLQSPFCCLFWPFRKWRKRKFSIRKFCSFLKEDVLAAIICLMDFLAPFDRSLIQSFRLFVQRQRQHHYRRRRQHFTKEKIAAQNYDAVH